MKGSIFCPNTWSLNDCVQNGVETPKRWFISWSLICGVLVGVTGCWNLRNSVTFSVFTYLHQFSPDFACQTSGAQNGESHTKGSRHLVWKNRHSENDLRNLKYLSWHPDWKVWNAVMFSNFLGCSFQVFSNVEVMIPAALLYTTNIFCGASRWSFLESPSRQSNFERVGIAFLPFKKGCCVFIRIFALFLWLFLFLRKTGEAEIWPWTTAGVP